MTEEIFHNVQVDVVLLEVIHGWLGIFRIAYISRWTDRAWCVDQGTPIQVTFGMDNGAYFPIGGTIDEINESFCGGDDIGGFAFGMCWNTGCNSCEFSTAPIEPG